MSLQGDLSTLDLPGLFQSLEAAQKSGLFTVQDGERATRMYLHKGRLVALEYPERPSLLDFLLASGDVSAHVVDSLTRKKRGKKSTSELLEAGGHVTRERLLEIVGSRLTDEACQLLMAGGGHFEFTECPMPEELFDPDETALGVALPMSPLMLEAARRSDHWQLVREHIPSDSIHFEFARMPREAKGLVEAEILPRLVELVDGTRSVAEVVAEFPNRRFETYELLADLARSRTIRAVDPADIGRRVRGLASRDRERAWELLGRALETAPRDLDLLCTKALLAEELGDLEQASEALKIVAHLHLENGDAEEAREALGRLKTLAEDDPFVWERSFELALAEKRASDALADGLRLVELYSGPGLHKQVCEVLEKLVGLYGKKWDLVSRLARARALAGDRKRAVKELEELGSAQLVEESYDLARRTYEEILAIEPANRAAKSTLAELKNGELVRRRARWRKLRRRIIAGVLAAVLLPWIGYEAFARRAWMDATREILRGGWLEQGRYDEAIARYQAVRERYGWATTSRYELPQTIAELEARRAGATAGAGGETATGDAGPAGE